MVDLDDVSTYPDCIREWVINKRDFFLRVIPIGSYNFDYKIIHKLQNIRMDDMHICIGQNRIKGYGYGERLVE